MVGVLTGKSCLQDNKIREHGLYGRMSMHVAIGRTRCDSTENFSVHRESTLDRRNKARVHGGNQGQGYHDSMSRRGDQLCQMLQRRQKDDGAGVQCSTRWTSWRDGELGRSPSGRFLGIMPKFNRLKTQ